MKKNAEIRVYRNGENIKIKNNMGGEWEFKTTRPQPMIAALVGLTMTEWFNHEETCSDEFEMTLYVESLDKK